MSSSPTSFLTASASPGIIAFARMQIPVGISDFRSLREGGFEYVDKTRFICDIIDRNNIKVILLPRPRRFGKTINLTMLRWFFEERDENLWHLFDGLHVARAGEKYRAHFQQYPVIFVSFKGTKADTLEGCQREIRKVIRAMYEPHRAALEGKLERWEQTELNAIVEMSDDWGLYNGALYSLTKWLHRAYGKRPIVLIDEYDAPIHSGYSNGYYDKIVSFMRSFLEAGLKDNDHLERAVMTGILRVAKESIFSGLNNAYVYSLLYSEFNTSFGFTDAEVFALLQKAGIPEVMEQIRSFYNGYDFGGKAIYNPWSILQFLANEQRLFQHYWLNTSANELIQQLLERHAFAVEKDIRALLEGGSIEKELDENIVFSRLDDNPDMLWSLLVFSGYLKAMREPIILGMPPTYRVAIPNREISHVYRTTFHSWMQKGLRAQGGALDQLLTSVLGGDTDEFEAQLQKFAMTVPSYHDVRGADPEQFYQGLMVGLLASLEPEYEVRSNRESGEGRPDLMIKPRRAGRPGVVLELKAARKKKRTLKQALTEGHEQFAKNDYAAELRAAGVQTVHCMVVGFDGKRVKVEEPKAPSKLRKVARAVKKVVKKAGR